MFSELIRLGAWTGVNPLAKIRQIKTDQTDQTELSFLSLEQINQLLDECRMRYAHLSPDHLESALRLSPLQ